MDKKVKMEVLKDLINMMRAKESESWKSAMKPKKYEDESIEESEEICPECGKSYDKCACESKKPKSGVAIIIGVKGEKSNKGE